MTETTLSWKFIQSALFLRCFNRTFTAPLNCSLETLIATFFVVSNSPEYPYIHIWQFSFVFCFVLHRSKVFLNKLVYILVSIITAFKNKKQRIKYQWICFILQLTILSPYFLFVLVVSTLLDTATIPYLGFAFFYIGYPKPQRGWSMISPVAANPKDSVSDGHLYQSMMP